MSHTTDGQAPHSTIPKTIAAGVGDPTAAPLGQSWAAHHSHRVSGTGSVDEDTKATTWHRIKCNPLTHRTRTPEDKSPRMCYAPQGRSSHRDHSKTNSQQQPPKLGKISRTALQKKGVMRGGGGGVTWETWLLGGAVPSFVPPGAFGGWQEHLSGCLVPIGVVVACSTLRRDVGFHI